MDVKGFLNNVCQEIKYKPIRKGIADELENHIQEINAEEIGKVACNLGAGRIKKEDNIDYAVGIELDKKVGTKVQKGEILGKIHANDTTKLEIAKKQVNDIIKISPEYCEKIQTIIEKI